MQLSYPSSDKGFGPRSREHSRANSFSRQRSQPEIRCCTTRRHRATGLSWPARNSSTSRSERWRLIRLLLSNKAHEATALSHDRSPQGGCKGPPALFSLKLAAWGDADRGTSARSALDSRITRRCGTRTGRSVWVNTCASLASYHPQPFSPHSHPRKCLIPQLFPSSHRTRRQLPARGARGDRGGESEGEHQEDHALSSSPGHESSGSAGHRPAGSGGSAREKYQTPPSLHPAFAIRHTFVLPRRTFLRSRIRRRNVIPGNPTSLQKRGTMCLTGPERQWHAVPCYGTTDPAFPLVPESPVRISSRPDRGTRRRAPQRLRLEAE